MIRPDHLLSRDFASHILRARGFCPQRVRSAEGLNQAQLSGGRAQVVVSPKGLFADGPIGSLAQPAEVHVNPRRRERALELGRHTLGPTGTLIALFTAAHNRCPPSLSIG